MWHSILIALLAGIIGLSSPANAGGGKPPEGFIAFEFTDGPVALIERMDSSFTTRHGVPAFYPDDRTGELALHVGLLCADILTSFSMLEGEYENPDAFCASFKRRNGLRSWVTLVPPARLADGFWLPGYPKQPTLVAKRASREAALEAVVATLQAERDALAAERETLMKRLAEQQAEAGKLKSLVPILIEEVKRLDREPRCFSRAGE